MFVNLMNRWTLMLSSLGAIVTVQLVLPVMAEAKLTAKCQIANQIKPVAERLGGEAMGVAYVVGIPLVVVAVVGVIIFANSIKSRGMMRMGMVVIAGLLALGLVVGIVDTVANPQSV